MKNELLIFCNGCIDTKKTEDVNRMKNPSNKYLTAINIAMAYNRMQERKGSK